MMIKYAIALAIVLLRLHPGKGQGFGCPSA
jgi:hypothetical protein